MKYQYPCKDCTRRAANCHSTCLEYLAAKAAHKAEKEKRWKRVAVDAYWVRVINRSKEIQIREKMKKR